MTRVRVVITGLKVSRSLFLGAAFLAIASVPSHGASGAVYFVATSGDDGSPGTKAQPWRHPESAVTKLAAGDTLYLRGGTYTLENPVIVDNSGTANARISIQSAPGEHAVIDAVEINGLPAVDIDGSARANQDGITINGNYIDVVGLEVRNSWTRGIRVSKGRHARLMNNHVHDNQDGGLVVAYPYGSHEVSDVLIQGNVSHHNAKSNSPTKENGMWSAGIAILNAKDVTIKNNTVYDNYGEGIGCYVVDRCDVIGNVAYDNFAVNLYYDNVTNSSMRGNLVYTEDNKEFYRAGTTPDGIGLANENYRTLHKEAFNLLDNDKIVNNIVVGGSHALFFGAYQGVLPEKTTPANGIKNSLIANNTLIGGTVDVIGLDADVGNMNNEVANNIFYQARGKVAASYDRNPAFYFHHNLWFGADPGDAQGPGDLSAVDPGFAKSGGTRKAASDFKLKTNSPAIGAAAVIPAVTTDFWGTARPAKGGGTLGAHEALETAAR